MPSSIYDFEVETLTGEKRAMADYLGEVGIENTNAPHPAALV